jgi:hypothetical protein
VDLPFDQFTAWLLSELRLPGLSDVKEDDLLMLDSLSRFETLIILEEQGIMVPESVYLGLATFGDLYSAVRQYGALGKLSEP